MEEAIKKIPENYSKKTNMLTGFYRETAQKGRRYINISEAVIDVYKTPYHEAIDRDRVQTVSYTHLPIRFPTISTMVTDWIIIK